MSASVTDIDHKARCEDYIRGVVVAAPPLTDQQRDRLGQLLRGVA